MISVGELSLGKLFESSTLGGCVFFVTCSAENGYLPWGRRSRKTYIFPPDAKLGPESRKTQVEVPAIFLGAVFLFCGGYAKTPPTWRIIPGLVSG